MQEHHVVVVGGGFAGLQLTNDLKRLPLRITLIDRRNHHLFQPLLYQVATTLLATSEIAWPIRSLYRDRPEVTTLLAEVKAVDTSARTVELASGETLSYDTLVLATGVTHAYFGHSEWKPVAPGLKTLEDATTIRRRTLLAFERAELATETAEQDAQMTFAIVGAGPTGVELAGIIAELAHTTLQKEFRRIDTRKTRVLLIEAGLRILPSFAEDLASYAAKTLKQRGVEILTGRAVTNCTANGVTIGDEFVPCRTIIWAAGVQASPAARWLGAEADRAGRVIVGKDLTVPGLPDVFAIGDTASVTQEDGSPVPGIAPAAKQQGAYVARLIRDRLTAGKATASREENLAAPAVSQAGATAAGQAGPPVKGLAGIHEVGHAGTQIATQASTEAGPTGAQPKGRSGGTPNVGSPPPFRYRHQGSLATIGNNSAIIDFGRIKLKGSLAWWIWGIAHIYFLIGTRWRFAVAWSWLWISISGQHSARLITQRETIKDEG